MTGDTNMIQIGGRPEKKRVLAPTPTHDVRSVAREFQIYSEFVEAAPYGSGHINDTYCAVFDQAGARVRYILQRINHKIFTNPPALMENIQRVTSHLAAKLSHEEDFIRR